MYKIVYDEKKQIFVFSDKIKNKVLARSKSKIKMYNKIIRCANIILKVIHTKLTINMFGLLFLKDDYKIVDSRLLNFKTNNKLYPLKIILKIKLPFTSYSISLYRVKFPYRDFVDAPIHNRVVIIFRDKLGYGFYKRIKYNFLWKDEAKYRSSSIKKLKKYNSSIFVRQSTNNSVFITIRNTNHTDDTKEQFKIYLAKLISFICYKKPILLYEKESNKYEESASVLYEQLINKGYKNVYYILNKNSTQFNNVAKQYLKNIIYKGTFKNYLYFFLAKTFIGTEVAAHAIDLRVTNRYIERKLGEKKYKYVFLQHGVMYMVSLASTSRKAFRKGNLMPLNSKIVVSSQEEANHFINQGNFDQEDLYITGLPKFDRNIKYKKSDKIIIMPTWRPWEYNEIRTNFKDTGYYKMLMNIINGIPQNLKNKIIVLPHPLFIETIKGADLPFETPKDKSYDEILREAALLITDYSSIAFDAFYRGSNVIFWWKDKETCMEQYKGYLMLNEKNAFGDICYDSESLRKLIYQNYKRKQKTEYIKNYQKLVEFNDNRNTERLINALIKDSILKK